MGQFLYYFFTDAETFVKTIAVCTIVFIFYRLLSE